jgi:hypothetical protein
LSNDSAVLAKQFEVWQQATTDQHEMEVWLQDIKAKLDDAVENGADVTTICGLLDDYEVIKLICGNYSKH